jgi:hypothetical protein
VDRLCLENHWGFTADGIAHIDFAYVAATADGTPEYYSVGVST